MEALKILLFCSLFLVPVLRKEYYRNPYCHNEIVTNINMCMAPFTDGGSLAETTCAMLHCLIDSSVFIAYS